jgi:hypothetical protein
MSEIARAGEALSAGDVNSLGALLARYVEIERIDYDRVWGWGTGMGASLRICGRLKPIRPATSEADGRRALLDSAEAVLALLAAVGAEHVDHPDIQFGGHVIRQFGGSPRLLAEGRINLTLSAPGSGG